jgi:excisionase family DNA binding protein
VTGAEAEQHAFLTKKEAAEYARVGLRTLERAMHDGELRYLGGGPRRFAVQIRPQWIEDWLGHRGEG